MQHKHSNLIQAWLNDNSVEFEFAYGSGVDFTWHDCDVNYLINNPKVQARLKSKPKKEKRWIAVNGESICFVNHDVMYPDDYQLIEIEIEAK